MRIAAVCMFITSLLATTMSCAPEPRYNWPNSCGGPYPYTGIAQSTSAIGVSARTTMNEGNDFIQNLGAELSAVLNRFHSAHPALQLFIQEPPVLPVVQATEASFNGWYGSHSENVDGTFTSVTSPTQGIFIALLNGIDIEIIFNTIAMESSIEPDGILDNFKLRIRSNQRGIVTPLIEQVDIDLDYNVLEFPPTAATRFQPGMDTQGYIEYTRNGPLGLQAVKYEMSRTLGSGDAAPGLKVTDGQFIRYKDLTADGSGRQWLSVNQISYVNPILGGSWILENATHIFQDDVVSYNGLIIAKSLTDYILNNAIELIGIGDVTFLTTIGPVTVGSLKGGPLQCDFNSQSATGAGPNIVLEWNDCTSQILMPTTQLNCERIIVP